MPHEPADVDVGRDRPGVVGEQHRERARARIPRARRVAVIGQAHERLVLRERDGLRRGRGGAHLGSGLLAREREQRLELEVVGKAPAARRLERAPLLVEREAPLPRRLERRGHAVRVTHDERRQVHEQPAVGRLGGDLAAPEHRRRERLAHRAHLVAVARECAVAEVRLLEEHAAAHAPERQHPGIAGLAAIEPDGIRAQPGLDALEVEEAAAFLVGPARFRELEQELAGLRVEVRREEPAPARQPAGLGCVSVPVAGGRGIPPVDGSGGRGTRPVDGSRWSDGGDRCERAGEAEGKSGAVRRRQSHGAFHAGRARQWPPGGTGSADVRAPADGTGRCGVTAALRHRTAIEPRSPPR